ncbi:hypothetical protein [Amycolatopsis sp. NPDC058986]|uniref:Mom family adenine methylcarbamoylation protein n=1 Tax=unclassified Amycolatopsis TaxID=2618356 RepID=UPI00367227DE
MSAASQLALPFTDLCEIPTASPWCQRWNRRRHSWRHIRDGGFDSCHYVVAELAEASAKAFVVEHHYSGSYPAATRRFGLFDVADGEPRLVGVAVFGTPAGPTVLTRAFPGLEPGVESLDCSRFVLKDECLANAESWFLARCHDELRAAGIRGVLSFADPVPRRNSAGHLTAVGHVGTIYQASNAVYTGRATARTLTLLPDGTILNARAAQKVRRQEQGHRYVEHRLIALGAPIPRAGGTPAVWLREALNMIGARRLRHRGAHRYAWQLGGNRRARERVALGHTAQQPYPKCADPEQQTSSYVDSL